MDDHRKGDWLQTWSGRVFWPLDPRPEDVSIADIAHSLSQTCRYAGHCREFYSVAQHSVLMASAASDENKLWALLHDAAEAYVCDVPRPLKPFLPGYKEIETGVMAVICQRFGLDPVQPAEVTRLDSAILADEMAQLMAPPARPWGLREPPLGITILPWQPADARYRFLLMFNALTREAR